MEGTATEFLVVEELIEKYGEKYVHQMVSEIKPAPRNWRKISFYACYLTTLVFWLAVSPQVIELDLHPGIIYPVALANIVMVKKFILMA